jgi:hypothetical protein
MLPEKTPYQIVYAVIVYSGNIFQKGKHGVSFNFPQATQRMIMQ